VVGVGGLDGVATLTELWASTPPAAPSLGAAETVHERAAPSKLTLEQEIRASEPVRHLTSFVKPRPRWTFGRATPGRPFRGLRELRLGPVGSHASGALIVEA